METLKENGLYMLRFLRVHINAIYDYKNKDRLNRSENNGILFWLSDEEKELVDNFERGLAAVPEDEKDSAFVDGMDKVYRQMLTELDAIGVKPIEAVGKEFDPEFHNAVMQVESEEYDSGIVAQELQKGYIYHDSVVRHSMVAVVQ